MTPYSKQQQQESTYLSVEALLIVGVNPGFRMEAYQNRYETKTYC